MAVPNGTKRNRAAILLAEDELSDAAISDTVGIGRTTLSRWKLDPEFAALVGDHRGRIVAEALKLPIAKKHKRVAVLDDLHSKALQVIADRAGRYTSEVADRDSAEAATRRMFGRDTPDEAATGLMARTETANTTGMITVNWQFDRALVSEIRDLEKQAAQELGQWEETLNVNHAGLVTQEYVIVEDVPWEPET